MFAQVQRDEDAGAAAAHVRAHVRPRVGGEPVGVLPRLRPIAPAGDRLARGACPRRRSPRHGRRRRVGLDHRARPRLVRPPDHRDDACRRTHRRHPPPRGVERGDLRRTLGVSCGAARRAAATCRSTSSTGRRFSARSSSSTTSCATSAAGSAASRPRRSRSSAETSTRRYIAEVDLGADGGSEPRLPSSSARRSGIRCQPFAAPRSSRRSDRAPSGCGLLPAGARLAASLLRPPAWRYVAPRTFDNSIGELSTRRGGSDRHASTRRGRPARPGHRSSGSHAESRCAGCGTAELKRSDPTSETGDSRALRPAIPRRSLRARPRRAASRERRPPEVHVHAHHAGDQCPRQQQDRRQREHFHDLVRSVLGAEDQEVERADDGILGVRRRRRARRRSDSVSFWNLSAERSVEIRSSSGWAQGGEDLAVRCKSPAKPADARCGPRPADRDLSLGILLGLLERGDVEFLECRFDLRRRLASSSSTTHSSSVARNDGASSTPSSLAPSALERKSSITAISLT